MKRVLLLAALSLATFARANFVQLDSVSEFEDLVATSQVPVVVQFGASWCGPCHQLIATFKRVAPSYQDSQVRLAHIDADEHSELRSYLMGGYPTVRTFVNGNLASPSFVGSQSESYLRRFIDNVVEGPDFEFLTDARPGAYCPVE